jgi:Tol biopolymer transport system component
MHFGTRTLVVAIAVMVLVGPVAAVGLGQAGGAGRSPGVFERVHGWIAVAGKPLIAIDPVHPARRVVLVRGGGEPLAWSRDGNELLYLARGDRMMVVRDDGTRSLIGEHVTGGSFTPDGGQVVYGDAAGGVYATPVGGGPRRVIRAPGHFPAYMLPSYGGGQLSPDGLTLATTRVRQDGRAAGVWLLSSDRRVPPRELISAATIAAVADIPAVGDLLVYGWSPDATHVLIATAAPDWPEYHLLVVRADGTGARPVGILRNNAYSASWSPDGKRIAGSTSPAGVFTRNADGSALRKLGHGAGWRNWTLSIAWNPAQ